MNSNNLNANGITRRTFLSAAGIAALTLSTAGLFGCAGGSGAGSSNDKKTITVAYVLNGKPTSYNDESNKPAGYEVDVVNEVAKVLSDKYTFKFEGVDQVAVFAGLASGKYNQGLTNSYWTPERAEKSCSRKRPSAPRCWAFLFARSIRTSARLRMQQRKG